MHYSKPAAPHKSISQSSLDAKISAWLAVECDKLILKYGLNSNRLIAKTSGKKNKETDIMVDYLVDTGVFN